jgi:hypothetical protein
MRIRSITAALLLALTACGGGGSDQPSPAQEDRSHPIVETYEKANEVSNSLNQREQQLEQMVEDMGG